MVKNSVKIKCQLLHTDWWEWKVFTIVWFLNYYIPLNWTKDEKKVCFKQWHFVSLRFNCVHILINLNVYDLKLDFHSFETQTCSSLVTLAISTEKRNQEVSVSVVAFRSHTWLRFVTLGILLSQQKQFPFPRYSPVIPLLQDTWIILIMQLITRKAKINNRPYLKKTWV